MPARSPSPNQRAESPKGATRTAILVLGMHRSGTSAVTRLLNLRGAALGRDLLPPKADNERGFWENRAIVELHERVLARQGQRWHDLAAAGGQERGAIEREFVAELPGVLTSQFEAARLFVVKDPRLSLLVPLWNEALARMTIRPAFVLTIRHPDEVAASLAQRDGLPAAQSLLLWLQHLVEAERATRGQARVFVHYERLLADWRAEFERITGALDIAWPDAQRGFESAADEFIAPALRHHRDADARTLPALLERVYACACAAAAGGAADFDAASAGYDDLMRFAAPLQRSLAERSATAEDRHADEISRARASIDDLAEQLAAARANIEALVAELAQSRQAVALKDDELDGARTHIDALVQELAVARDVVAEKDQQIGAARQNIGALATEIAHARDAFAEKADELDAARSNIDALTAELDRSRESHASRQRDLDAARANLNARAVEIDAARRNIDALVAEIDAARTNIGNLVAEIAQARHAHELRDATEATLRGDLQALRRSRWFRLGRRLRVIGGPEA